MNPFSYIRTLFGGKKALVDATAGWVSLTGDDRRGVNESNLLLANEEWVAIAVDKVASAVASVPFKVMQYRRSGDDQEVFDGPLAQFLEKPSANFTGKDFIYLNTLYKELTGNAFWERDGASKFNPLVPTAVVPVIQGDKLTGYRYSFGNESRTISYKEILHDRYIDPAKPYWGKGKLAKIARWVDISAFSNEFLRRFFINGATFGGFIETEEETEARIKLIKLGLAQDHAGVTNAHKLGVLPKGAKYAKAMANMQEIEMGATDDRYRDKILAAFGVPKTLVGLTTEVNRASAEASEYIFARYTVKPIVDDLIEFLNVNVAPKLDPTGKTYFAYTNFIPTNMETELKEREIALNKQPYKTVNEVRAEVGLPPVPGGDTIYGNPMQTPLGTPAPAPDAPTATNPQEDKPAPTKAVSRAIPAHVRGAAKRENALDNLVTKLADAVIDTVAALPDARELEDAAVHRSFVSRVEGYTGLIENGVRDFNNRQQRDLVQRLNQITKAVSKTDLWDMNQEVQLMVDFVTPILGGLLTEQALAEWSAQGFAGKFDSSSDLVKRVLGMAARRLAKSYNNTTANLIKAALNDGIQAGEGIGDLTKRVQQVYEFSDMVRAKAVAHTESFYIANKANKLAYQQSGVVKTMRWYTAEAERVCEFCRPMHGKTIDVGSVFFAKGAVITGDEGGTLALDYRRMDVPPLHTNCRCFIRPEEISID